MVSMKNDGELQMVFDEWMRFVSELKGLQLIMSSVMSFVCLQAMCQGSLNQGGGHNDHWLWSKGGPDTFGHHTKLELNIQFGDDPLFRRYCLIVIAARPKMAGK